MEALKATTRCPNHFLTPGSITSSSLTLGVTTCSSTKLVLNTRLSNQSQIGAQARAFSLECCKTLRLELGTFDAKFKANLLRSSEELLKNKRAVCFKEATRKEMSSVVGHCTGRAAGVRADSEPRADQSFKNETQVAASVSRKWEELGPQKPKQDDARVPLSEITQALAAAGSQRGGKKWEEGEPPETKVEEVPPKPSIPKSRLAAIIAGDFHSQEDSFSEEGRSEGIRRRRSKSGWRSNEDGEQFQRGPRFFTEREPVEVDPAVREQQIADWLGRNGLSRQKAGLVTDELPNKREQLTRNESERGILRNRRTDWREIESAADMSRGRRAGNEIAGERWLSSRRDSKETGDSQNGRLGEQENGLESRTGKVQQSGRFERGEERAESNGSEQRTSQRRGDSWRAETKSQWESDSWRGLAREAAEEPAAAGQFEDKTMQSRHASKGNGSFLRRVPTVEVDRDSWLLGGPKPNSTERLGDPLAGEITTTSKDAVENAREGLVGEASELIGKRDFVRVKLPKDNQDPVDAADLHQAIMQRDFARIWWLVERRQVDVNQLDDHVLGYFTTALHIACEIGDPVMVTRFLEQGARADIADEFGRFPIVSALIGKERVLTKMGIIETLLTTGIGVEQRNPVNGKYPLHYAVVGPNDLIVYLRDKGADLNVKDFEGKTPLHDSLEIQDPSDPAWKNMDYLLGLGAKPNAKDKEGRTALHIAAQRHEYVRCKELLRWKALVHVRDKQGRTPMRYVRPQPYGEDSIISLFQRFGGKL